MPSQRTQKAGHQEVYSETLAKFEFFEHGFNPYSRYLDVDKVDLVLRARAGSLVYYLDVQVKFSSLYPCLLWQTRLGLDCRSWYTFKTNDFSETHDNFFVAYLFADRHQETDGDRYEYKGDIFIFSGHEFRSLINASPRRSDNRKSDMHIVHRVSDDHWFLLKQSRRIDRLDATTAIDVTAYRRNFGALRDGAK